MNRSAEINFGNYHLTVVYFPLPPCVCVIITKRDFICEHGTIKEKRQEQQPNGNANKKKSDRVTRLPSRRCAQVVEQ